MVCDCDDGDCNNGIVDGDCNGGVVDGDFDAGYNGLDKVYGCDIGDDGGYNCDYGDDGGYNCDYGDDGGYNCDYGVGDNGCQGNNVANISVITSVVLNCFHFPVSWHFLGDDFKDHDPLGALRLVTSLCIRSIAITIPTLWTDAVIRMIPRWTTTCARVRTTQVIVDTWFITACRWSLNTDKTI